MPENTALQAPWTNIKYKKILVTGGAGFIGSHLCEELLKRGCHVTVIDNLSTGRWCNIAHLKDNPHFRVIISVVADPVLLEKEVPQHDFVFHLASAVGVKLIMERPVTAVESTFLGTDAILKFCAKYRVPVMITSSSEVYGKSNHIPFREDDDVIMGATEKRRWAYSCAKALDEFLAFAHFLETQLPVYVVRLFNTVGPRQLSHYGMVLPNFVRQALSGQVITVHGDGQQRRCFCAVQDVVEAMIRLIHVEAAMGQAVNLGSTEEISMLDLANKVIALTHSSSTIQMISYEKAYGPGFDDMQRRIPDLTRAKQYIQWQPQYNLHDIILQVAQYYQTPKE